MMGKLLGMFLFLRDRWNEPSSRASLVGLCALAGYKIDPGIIQDGFNVAAIAFGLLGFLTAESKPLTKV